MENSVELWVCPYCEVLQGIEITLPPNSTKMQANCLNCGVSLTMEEVHFLDPVLVQQVYSYVMEKLVDLDPDEIRFSWVSNRTVGLIFELSRS
ncbi:MAG: hypothetical protein IH840_16375, partial [Candidatus Heimdallarchaeota archaeon]|nr:hypothetical protein [Candidatus Heimdallarchaeota archaeon]